MSRIHLALALGLVGAPLAAQSGDQVTAEQAVETAKKVYGPAAPQKEPDCKKPEGNEIVVCAKLQEQSQFRVRTDEDAENDYAKATMNKGDPKAPNVDGPGIFQGPATVSNLCIPGLQKCPPPPAYFIDFKELPDTPPGSDADRIGKGLAPTGNEPKAEPEPPAAPTPPDQPDDGAADEQPNETPADAPQ